MEHNKLPGLMQPVEKLARAVNAASELARSASTNAAGSIYIPNGDGTGTLIGEINGLDDTGTPVGKIEYLYDTVPPSAPTGLTWTSDRGDITGHWDGSLTEGIPSDFAYVELRVSDESSTMAGRLAIAGSTTAPEMTVGTKYDCYAVAVDVQGNVSEESEHTTLECVDKVEALKDAVNEDVEAVKKQAETLEKSLSDANQKIEQVATDVDGIKTTAENAAKTAEESLTVATEAKQTATEISTTAEAAFESANSALEQSSEAVQKADSYSVSITEAVDTANSALEQASNALQTANGFQQTVEETYLTKTEAEGQYASIASVSDVKQTANGIEISLSRVITESSENKDNIEGLLTKTAWIRFGETSLNDGQQGLILGSEDEEAGDITLQLINNQLAFVQDGVPVAYITDNLFNIKQGVLTEELHLGERTETAGSWIWRKRPNEHLGLRHQIAGASTLVVD